jgi:hypothetical protein
LDGKRTSSRDEQVANRLDQNLTRSYLPDSVQKQGDTMLMAALKVAFGLTVALSTLASCADESQQPSTDGERGGTEVPGAGGGSSSAGAAAHAWCKKNEWKLYKVFDGIKGVWVGAPDNIWIIVSHLHTGFYGDDPNGQIGVQSYVPFLAHWNGQDLCIAEGNPRIPFSYQGRTIGGTANDLWLESIGIDTKIDPKNPVSHWNGIDWKSFPDMTVGSFYSIGPSDLYATGERLQHWDGSTWTEVTSPDLGEMTGYEIWPAAQGKIWTLPGIRTDNNACDVAVLSSGGPIRNGSCILRKSALNHMFRLSGIGDQPWVVEQNENPDYFLAGDRVLRLEGNNWNEALYRGNSAKCIHLYSSAERVICVAKDEQYMWAPGQEEATAIVLPPGGALDRNQKRDALWAFTSSKVFRGTDGVNWELVVSF